MVRQGCHRSVTLAWARRSHGRLLLRLLASKLCTKQPDPMHAPGSGCPNFKAGRMEGINDVQVTTGVGSFEQVGVLATTVDKCTTAKSECWACASSALHEKTSLVGAGCPWLPSHGCCSVCCLLNVGALLCVLPSVPCCRGFFEGRVRRCLAILLPVTEPKAPQPSSVTLPSARLYTMRMGMAWCPSICRVGGISGAEVCCQALTAGRPGMRCMLREVSRSS